MSGNSFGQQFKVTTFGESHGSALGVVIDGMPAGVEISLDDFKKELKRRAPGQLEIHTARKEEDSPEILSGIFENKTLGIPITVIVRNTDQRSGDYDQLKSTYRPGHADETTIMKYGFRDHRGGGRASGRETVARVIAGYFAGLILPQTSFYAYISQIGQYKLPMSPKTHDVDRGSLGIPDAKLTQEVTEFLKDLKSKGESAGAMISLSIKNAPRGLGEPVFDKLKADLAKAMLSIPACVGFHLGAGMDFLNQPGSVNSQNPEAFGGIEGGISNGKEIFLEVLFKPPSTVGEKAQAGRHDPCVAPRAVVVVESMAKIVMADHFLRQSAYASFLPSSTDQ